MHPEYGFLLYLQRCPRVSTVYILEKMHGCMFFDEEIQTSMFFPTLHDAMLHVLEKKGSDNRHWVVRKAIHAALILLKHESTASSE